MMSFCNLLTLTLPIIVVYCEVRSVVYLLDSDFVTSFSVPSFYPPKFSDADVVLKADSKSRESRKCADNPILLHLKIALMP